MNTSLLSAALPSIARATSTALSQERTTMAAANDPSLWLEDIEGEGALAWARAENEKTLGVLQSDPRYRCFYEQALSILQAKDRIAYVSLGRRGLENFWQDENHVRGIW
ncbi:S9 family peptidase, partial [Bradyrhizobium sp. UFLA06-06]